METTDLNSVKKKQPQDYFLMAARHIRLNVEQLKTSWEFQVRKQVENSNKQSSISLIDSLSVFLEDLATFIQEGHYENDTLHRKGMSQEHGKFRASFTGYFLPQLLKEFSILRKVIIESLQHEELLTYEVRSVIDKTIDDAISLAATEFTMVQSNAIKGALSTAEKSNHALEHFAVVAAHDLKSPLATIIGFLNILKEEHPPGGNPEHLGFIELSLGASSRMISLIDSLLSFAKLSTNEKALQPIDMNSVVDAAQKNLAAYIKKENISIHVASLPSVMGDVDLLTELVQNLMANAIKFKSQRPLQIEISFTKSGAMYTFSVKDNGIGFDPNKKKEIFELYKKLTGGPGSGIGLATCKRIVELHGGEIFADSKPGEGSEFFFTLKPSV